MRGLIVSLARGETSDYVVKVEDFKPRGKYAGGGLHLAQLQAIKKGL